MKNERKIRKELITLDITIKAKNNGLRITPKGKDITLYSPTVRQIISVVDKYERSFYVDFEFGWIRIH